MEIFSGFCDRRNAGPRLMFFSCRERESDAVERLEFGQKSVTFSDLYKK